MNKRIGIRCSKQFQAWLFGLVLCVLAGVADAARPTIELTGVMQGQSGTAAYIDGKLLRVGDEVAGYTIIAIRNSGIQVQQASSKETYFVPVSNSSGVREIGEDEINQPSSADSEKEEWSGGVTAIRMETAEVAGPSQGAVKSRLTMNGRMIISLSLMGIGFLVMFVASIWYLVACFQESIWWGLGALFVPFVELVFLFMHWDRAKKPFLISVLGYLIMMASIFTSPELYESIQP